MVEDDRERIFAGIRHSLRSQERFSSKRDPRSPLLSQIASGFESSFRKFEIELTKLGGEAVVLDGPKAMLDFFAARLDDGTTLFLYDDLIPEIKSAVADLAESKRLKLVENLKPGYDKREAAVFEAAVSSCMACIAETGTVVFRTDTRLPAALSTKLFIAAERSLLLPSLDDLFADKFSNFNGSNLFLISGPSRTADIEKELVTGVHGPKQVFVIFI